MGGMLERIYVDCADTRAKRFPALAGRESWNRHSRQSDAFIRGGDAQPAMDGAVMLAWQLTGADPVVARIIQAEFMTRCRARRKLRPGETEQDPLQNKRVDRNPADDLAPETRLVLHTQRGRPPGGPPGPWLEIS